MSDETITFPDDSNGRLWHVAEVTYLERSPTIADATITITTYNQQGQVLARGDSDKQAADRQARQLLSQQATARMQAYWHSGDGPAVDGGGG